MKKIIAISGAGLKEEAGNDALDITGLTSFLKLVSTKTKTGVNEQPRGFKEIFLGAWNRAGWAMDGVENAEFGLGMENGLEDRTAIVPGRGGDLIEITADADYAVVILRERDSDAYTFGISQGVICPHRFVELSRDTDWRKTAGHFHSAETGSDGANWHAYETGGLLMRKSILTTPCVDVFARRFITTRFFVASAT